MGQADTTHYTYDNFGNLTKVVLPRQTEGGQAKP